MTYLVLGVLFGSLTVVGYKLAAQNRYRRVSILAVERITIVLVLLALIPFISGYAFDPAVLWVSLLAATTVLLARLLLLKALTLGPAPVVWTTLNLSVSIPVLASIIFWHETPEPLQVVGLALVPASVLLMRQRELVKNGAEASDAAHRNPDPHDRSAGPLLFLTLACFVVEGIFATTFLLIKELNLADSRNLFLVTYNVMAGILAVGWLVHVRRRPSRTEILTGMFNGLFIGLSAIFCMLAILAMASMVFYPVATVLGICFGLALLWLGFRERPSPRQWVGVTLGVVAIALISV